MTVSSFFSALLFTIRNLSALQTLFLPKFCHLWEWDWWTLSTLQGSQGSTDLATSPAAAEGTGFAPKYTDYCQCEQHNVACFTPAENLIQGIKKKKIKLKVIKFKLCQSLGNFSSGSNFFNFCFMIAHIFPKQFSSVRWLGANDWIWQASEVCDGLKWSAEWHKLAGEEMGF